MFETSLARSVAQFAEVTQDIPDPELDRTWAWGAYDSEGVRFAFFRIYEELRQLATKTALERAVQGPALSTAQRALAQYHAAYQDLQAVLLGVEGDVVNKAPAEGEWSLREIVAHIVRADAGFFGVVKYALDRHRSGDGRPAEIPDEAWNALIGKDDAAFEAIMQGPFNDIQSYHKELHMQVLKAFAGISEEELALPSLYWEGYELSLRFRLHRFDAHIRQHTIQADKTLIGIGQPLNEAKRLLRLIYAALAEVEGLTIGAWEAGAEPGRELAEKIESLTGEIADILT